MRWSEHLSEMSHGHLSLEAFRQVTLRRSPRADPELNGGIVCLLWSWNDLGLPGGAGAGCLGFSFEHVASKTLLQLHGRILCQSYNSAFLVR